MFLLQITSLIGRFEGRVTRLGRHTFRGLSGWVVVDLPAMILIGIPVAASGNP